MEAVKWATLVFLVCILWRTPHFSAAEEGAGGDKGHVLVLGGNGFIGSSIVERLLGDGYKVTIVNRGNFYWDSKERILPHVQHIKCDRKKDHMEHCPKLLDLIKEVGEFTAVMDLSAQGPYEITEAVKYLHDKVQLYVLISSDAIYDVCGKSHMDHTKETDAVRPPTEDEQNTLNYHHEFGHRKMGAEEELIKQRVEDGGFPFVILRLPDVVGPRDSTYRWWIYQLWLKLAPHIPDSPVTIPSFLTNYQMSLVYVEDVSRTVVSLLEYGPQIKDQAINLAFPETFTLEQLIVDIRNELGLDGPSVEFVEDTAGNAFYLYPKARRGPLDVARAESLLDWSPTPWSQVVKDTVSFFEEAFTDPKFDRQRDEIIQIVGHHVHSEDKDKFYDTLEKIYDIELHHFRVPKDEL